MFEEIITIIFFKLNENRFHQVAQQTYLSSSTNREHENDEENNTKIYDNQISQNQ